MTSNRRDFMKVAAGAVGGVALAATIQPNSVAHAQVAMGNIPEPGTVKGPVSALTARGAGGHRFVWMGDCCSGVAGQRHERNFAAVNKVLQSLDPMPEDVVFLGDNVSGYTADEAELRAQWKYFLEKEFNFLPASIPVHHITSNHNTYSPMAEAVFRDVHQDLRRTGRSGKRACHTGCVTATYCASWSTRPSRHWAATAMSRPTGSTRY